ncbi:hypothetical protein LX81_00075 [Palleronia aestuarii]|uniref:Uncharacterized protein n=1 Tax=Palleronia aestuarii TaxID=568105 RepID=A0A2W7QCQ8_9RHOB|nr:hypothetical protein [Palleronia aestuarii]PZX19619.1 hypothetical protein LX81_00075 [Palleronia aestuarii]
MKISSIPFAGLEVRLPNAHGRGAGLGLDRRLLPQGRLMSRALSASRSGMSRLFAISDRDDSRSRVLSRS